MVALEAAAVPFRLEGAVVVGGFSEAWHLLICLESRSLYGGKDSVRHRSGGVGQEGGWDVNVPSSELIAAMLALVWSVSSVWKERGGKRWVGSRRGGARPTWEGGAGERNSRERMCRATCCGLVKVDWHTGHCEGEVRQGGWGRGGGRGGGEGQTLWSPAIVC